MRRYLEFGHSEYQLASQTHDAETLMETSDSEEIRFRCPACRQISGADDVKRRWLASDGCDVHSRAQQSSPRAIQLAKAADTCEELAMSKRIRCDKLRADIVLKSQDLLETAKDELEGVVGQDIIQAYLKTYMADVLKSKLGDCPYDSHLEADQGNSHFDTQWYADLFSDGVTSDNPWEADQGNYQEQPGRSPDEAYLPERCGGLGMIEGNDPQTTPSGSVPKGEPDQGGDREQQGRHAPRRHFGLRLGSCFRLPGGSSRGANDEGTEPQSASSASVPQDGPGHAVQPSRHTSVSLTGSSQEMAEPMPGGCGQQYEAPDASSPLADTALADSALADAVPAALYGWPALADAVTKLGTVKGPVVAAKVHELMYLLKSFGIAEQDLDEYERRARQMRRDAEVARMNPHRASSAQVHDGRVGKRSMGLQVIGSAPGALAYRCLNCGQDFEVPAAIGEKMSLVSALHGKLSMYRDRHLLAESWAGFYYKLLTFPTLVFSAAITLASAIWPEEGDIDSKVVVACVSAANTVLISVASLFGFQGQKEAHGQAAKMYDTMLTSLEYRVEPYLRLAKTGMNLRTGATFEQIDQEISNFVVECEKRIFEIDANVPVLPQWIKKQAKLDSHAQRKGQVGRRARADLERSASQHAQRLRSGLLVLKVVAWLSFLLVVGQGIFKYDRNDVQSALQTAKLAMNATKIALRGASQMPHMTWWAIVLVSALALLIMSFLAVMCSWMLLCLRRFLCCADVFEDLLGVADKQSGCTSSSNQGGRQHGARSQHGSEDWDIVVGRAIGRSGIFATLPLPAKGMPDSSNASVHHSQGAAYVSGDSTALPE